MSFINCTDFKRIKQGELKTFTDGVYNNMNGIAVYAPFQQAVTDMNAGAEVYQQALVQSKSRATKAIDAKKDAQAELYSLLTRIAKSMDAAWTTNEHDKLKTDTGFSLYKTPERHNVTFVNPPTNLQAYNDIRRGVIIVAWKKAQYAVTTAFEVQLEDGPWQNGIYCEQEHMELTYPFGTKLLIRGKTVGPKLLTSDHTPPVEVMVS